MHIPSKLKEIEIPQDDPFKYDVLDRQGLASDLTSMVTLYSQTGCVIAINGEWGTGKTTFLRMWSQRLLNNAFRVVYFNAWESDYVEDPFISLVAELKDIGTDEAFEKLVPTAIKVGACLFGLAKGVVNKYVLDVDSVMNELNDLYGERLKKYLEQNTKTLEHA